MRRWRAAALGLFCTLAACAQAQDREPAGWAPVAVTASPARLSETEAIGARYGALIFRGGLELKSANPMFGGWSGLEIGADGRLVAVSDDGAFFSARIELDERGDLAGLAETRIALMRGENGQPLDGKEARDAEDIVRLPDGRYAVSFEQRHRIWIYDLDGKGPAAGAVAGPAVPQNMSENEGLEALAVTAEGDLLAGREFAADRKPPTQFFRIRMNGAPWVSGAAEVTENYALTALRLMPDGDYAALQRFYFPILGVRIMLRRYRGAGLADAPPHLDGPELATIAKPLLVDNFEGLAVAKAPSGATRLYIISDDNFSASQKTLLYAFDLAEPKYNQPNPQP